MNPIIPSFTMSERSIITPANPRGWSRDITNAPAAYFEPWQAAIKDAGAVFLLRPFGINPTGYVTHTRTCYGGYAGKTFPLGPVHGLSDFMYEVIGQWCDDGVIVYLYCGGIELPTRMAGALTELEAAAHRVRQYSSVPDHANVCWVLDNIGEKDPNEITPTDYMVMALRAVGREVRYEPMPRWNQVPIDNDYDNYVNLWNRQRAAHGDKNINRLSLASMVMVGGNKPDPKEGFAQLATPEARIAEARWQIGRYPVNTVALATAGLTPERWMKDVPR